MKEAIKSHGFTEARKNLTALIDAAQSHQPQRIRKRKASEEDVLVMTSSLLRAAMSVAGERRFESAVLNEQNGSVTMTLEPFGLAVNARSKSEAVSQLMQDVRLYSDEYFARSSLYLQSPNRRSHLPLVLQVLLCSTDDELKELLGLA